MLSMPVFFISHSMTRAFLQPVFFGRISLVSRYLSPFLSRLKMDLDATLPGFSRTQVQEGERPTSDDCICTHQARRAKAKQPTQGWPGPASPWFVPPMPSMLRLASRRSLTELGGGVAQRWARMAENGWAECVDGVARWVGSHTSERKGRIPPTISTTSLALLSVLPLTTQPPSGEISDINQTLIFPLQHIPACFTFFLFEFQPGPQSSPTSRLGQR